MKQIKETTKHSNRLLILTHKRNIDILGLELETYMYNINNETYELIGEYLKHPDLSAIKEKIDKLMKESKK